MTVTVYHNARIHTLDPEAPAAQAIAIRADDAPGTSRILALGPNHRILQEFGSNANVHDLAGGAVLPGLTDAHLHLKNYALSLQRVDCETPSRQEFLKRVARRAADTPPGTWILGHGWNANEWEEGVGDPADLDAITPEHPVYLTAKSLHAAWANRRARQIAHLGPGTPDPPGGRMDRDIEGRPNGLLYESAMELVSEAIPESSLQTLVEAIRDALPTLWRLGLTGVHDFDRTRCFAALQILHQNEALKLRVIKNLPMESLPQISEVGLRSGFGDDFLRVGAIKAFSDGALGARTAAMLDPYLEEPDNRGILLLDFEELFEHARLATAHGLPMTVHAIGDRANHEVLRAFSQVRQYERENDLPHLRHRIEHVQVLHPDDLSRLGELNVIASMQPLHAPSDMPTATRYWGPRTALAYAWRSLLDEGTRLAFGSDAPVESPNPFWGLHAAITRRRADGSPGPEGWIPDQRLGLYEALRAYTVGAAYAGGVEDRLGMLAPGYLADMIVLETDPFQCDPAALRELSPIGTMIDGQWVHAEFE